MRIPFIVFVLSVALVFNAIGQEDAAGLPQNTTLPIYPSRDTTEYAFTCRRVETAPVFCDGTEDWPTYLRKKINNSVPKLNGCPPGSYTVRINYIIGRDGCIFFTTPITHLGYGMEDEAIRTIGQSPKWIPGTQNGRIVNAYRFELITFEVSTVENEFLFSFNRPVY